MTRETTINPNALHTRYRPEQLDQVWGHGSVVTALIGVIENGDSQQFMFSGPFGTGKTTLARITCGMLGIDPREMTEVDAATNGGIQRMREIQDSLRFMPLHGDKRAIIVDEAHQLSKDAIDSLLKITEEPPEHLFWFLCTTIPNKLPPTIHSRFTHFRLKEISEDDLTGLVESICQVENIELPSGVLTLVVREAKGSARQALQNLTICRNVEDRANAVELLRQSSESDAGFQLAKMMAAPSSWPDAMKIVEKLDGANYEGIRIQVFNYLAACARNSKDGKKAVFFLSLMENWCTPFWQQGDGQGPLLLAIGRTLFPPA